MAGLTANTIGDLELPSSHALGNIIGVAIEADLGGVRCRQSEVLGNPLRTIVEQNLVSLGVLVFALPGHVLVLQDRRILVGLHAAVARATRT